MSKMITLAEAKILPTNTIRLEIGKREDEIQKLGLSAEKSKEIVASIISLGIAYHEKVTNFEK